MLDVALIREKPEWVKTQLARLGDEAALRRIDDLVTLDARRRDLIRQREDLQKFRNVLNKAIGMLRGNKQLAPEIVRGRAYHAARAIAAGEYDAAAGILGGTGTAPVDDVPAAMDAAAALEQLAQAMGSLSNHAAGLDATVTEVETELNTHLLWLPNLPHESVPFGHDDSDNRPWPPEGTFRTFDFTPKAHWDLGPALGIIDFERGVRLAGSRFYVLKGQGARLQRALIALFLDMARAKGFTEVYVPYLVKEDMLIGASQFPKFRDVVYSHQEEDGEALYLLPTAEVAITNLHRDEILAEQALPLSYVGHTPCFRREKAAAGRDTRGIKRVHQFEKVEMYQFTTPETSYATLERLTEAAADICRALQIPFRRLEICTGDLGFSATKKYDIEMWAPGCEEWLEVSSCSNTESFQARRAMIRYYPEGSKKAQFVHTLNGSGLALPRVIIAILENYQQADGSVSIPAALRPYLGGEERITPA